MSGHVYSAVKAIIEREGKFLVIKQKLPDRTVWDMPGGKVEFGESPYDTLVREVKEEVGLEVVLNRPLGFFWFFRNDGDQVVCTTFVCSAIGEINLLNNPADEDIVEFRWVTKEEFMKDNYPVSHESLKTLIEQL